MPNSTNLSFPFFRCFQHGLDRGYHTFISTLQLPDHCLFILMQKSHFYWASHLLALTNPPILIIVRQPLRQSPEFSERWYKPSSQTSFLSQLWNSLWGKNHIKPLIFSVLMKFNFTLLANHLYGLHCRIYNFLKLHFLRTLKFYILIKTSSPLHTY